MTAYINMGFKCGICSSEINMITDGQLQSNRVFNRDLKNVLCCSACWKKINNNPEQILCNLKGCRVLKEPNSDYCCRHDETFITEVFKIPEIE